MGLRAPTEIFSISAWTLLEDGQYESPMTRLLIDHEPGRSRRIEVEGAFTDAKIYFCLTPDNITVSDDFDQHVAPVESPSVSYPSQLLVCDAGFADINGVYVRHGTCNQRPRWAHRDSGRFFLRGGSDGNWCIVNNEGGEKTAPGSKEFYYVHRADDLLSTSAWEVDSDGYSPAPTIQADGPDEFLFATGRDDAAEGVPFLFRNALREQIHGQPRVGEQLLRAIARRGSALLAAPTLPAGARPIALHLHHFSNSSSVCAARDTVNDDSFRGLDDEQIRPERREETGEVWSYVGK